MNRVEIATRLLEACIRHGGSDVLDEDLVGHVVHGAGDILYCCNRDELKDQQLAHEEAEAAANKYRESRCGKLHPGHSDRESEGFDAWCTRESGHADTELCSAGKLQW